MNPLIYYREIGEKFAGHEVATGRQASGFIQLLMAEAKKARFVLCGMAGIEPTPSESECDWTPLSP
jgi:hypothetical protein